MKTRGRLTGALLVVVLAAGMFLAGYGMGQRAVVARSADDQGIALLRELLAQVRREYLNPVPEASRLFDGAARGLLDALGDPYTRYMDARVFKEFSQDAAGFFFGVGIFIDIRDRYLIVVQPIEGTPAHRAGLRSGDRILYINKVPTEGMALQEAVARIRGPAGTKVTLRVGRDGQINDLEITRARVQIVSVQGPGTLDPAVQKELAGARLGYVRVLTFNEQTPKDIASALDNLSREGARGLILDLRNNGGGLLGAATQVADRFVPDGQPVVHVVDREGRRKTDRAGSGAKLTLPVVVLVNEFTASASEILAGALRDSARATLVGQRSFGKGVIQTLFSLTGGGAAAVTTAKYLTPAGQDIHGKGIQPDVTAGDRLEGKAEAEVDRIQAAQLRRGVDVLKQRVAQRR